MITVLGATGGQGGAVLRALLEAEQPVRAVVRDRDSPRARALAEYGVEVVAAELTDVDALTTAFDGASAGFAFSTPFDDGVLAEEEQGEAIIEAAGTSDLPHLVFSSVASAILTTGIPHFDSKAHIEHVLKASDIPATVIAPTYFFDNILGSFDDIAAGRLPLALPPDKPLQQVARRDLGAMVAEVMAEPTSWIGQRVEVAGDEPTPSEMAAAVSRAAGGMVRHQQVPLQDVRSANPDLGAMFTYLSDVGYSVNIPRLREQFPNIQWTSFAEWAMAQHWPTPRR